MGGNFLKYGINLDISEMTSKAEPKAWAETVCPRALGFLGEILVRPFQDVFRV